MNLKKYLNTYSGLGLIFLLVISSIPIQKNIDANISKKDVIRKTLYMNSSTLKKLSIGYNELLADIYWIRAIQFFANAEENYDNAVELYKYFDLITDLDPYFVNAYRYGGTFLADKQPLGLGEVELGVNLLDKGRKNNPDNYRIVLDEAFIYFLYTSDYRKAADLFNEASEKKVNLSDKRKASIKGMAALALTKDGNLKLAKQIWLHIYQNTENEGRKNFALKNLMQIQTRETEEKLTNALRKYYRDTKTIPNNVQILIDKGYSEPIIQNNEYGDKFIILVDKLLVKNEKLAQEEYNYAISLLNSKSSKFKRYNNRYPYNLDELKDFINKSDLLEFPKHPYNDEFAYDSSTGKVE